MDWRKKNCPPWNQQVGVQCRSNNTSSWSIRRLFYCHQCIVDCKSLLRCRYMCCSPGSSLLLMRNILVMGGCRRRQWTPRRRERPRRGRRKISTSLCISGGRLWPWPRGQGMGLPTTGADWKSILSSPDGKAMLWSPPHSSPTACLASAEGDGLGTKGSFNPSWAGDVRLQMVDGASLFRVFVGRLWSKRDPGGLIDSCSEKRDACGREGLNECAFGSGGWKGIMEREWKSSTR